jgi:protein-S-isoprenylcysteine O-methyltransferase Ste14
VGGIEVLKLIVSVVASVGIVLVSWSSLRNRRSHGFYRFFAFESILLLLLLNIDNWFRTPLAIFQVISWLLLTLSLVLAIHGFHLLRVVGRPQGQIENTTRLVRLGAYRYIRHPLYSSLLFLGWGIFFKNPSLLGGALALAVTVSLIETGRVEEEENLEKFGDDYAAYVKTTKMFIPFMF